MVKLWQGLLGERWLRIAGVYHARLTPGALRLGVSFLLRLRWFVISQLGWMQSHAFSRLQVLLCLLITFPFRTLLVSFKLLIGWFEHYWLLRKFLVAALSALLYFFLNVHDWVRVLAIGLPEIIRDFNVASCWGACWCICLLAQQSNSSICFLQLCKALLMRQDSDRWSGPCCW